MVNFVETMKVCTAFVANILAMPFFVFGSFANFVIFCLGLSLIGFVLRSIWGGDVNSD